MLTRTTFLQCKSHCAKQTGNPSLMSIPHLIGCTLLLPLSTPSSTHSLATSSFYGLMALSQDLKKIKRSRDWQDQTMFTSLDTPSRKSQQRPSLAPFSKLKAHKLQLPNSSCFKRKQIEKGNQKRTACDSHKTSSKQVKSSTKKVPHKAVTSW